MFELFFGATLFCVALIMGLLAVSCAGRVLAFARLKCPHCGAQYGLNPAVRSRQVVFFVVYEKDATWPRWGEREENIRGINCKFCKRYAVFNGYGQRHEVLEG